MEFVSRASGHPVVLGKSLAMSKPLFSLIVFTTLLSAAAGALAQTLVFTSQTTPNTEDLRGISFADTARGFACGTGGTILKTVNGGTTWTLLTSGTTEDLWDIKVVPGSSGQKAVAVGDNNTILKTVNGGTSWTAQTVPFAAGSFVFGVRCIDTATYYACGGDFATLAGATLKTTNGGTTWTKVDVPGSVFLDKIFMLNSSTGYSVGTNTSFSDGSIQKTTSGTAFTTSKTSADVITNLWCHSAASVVAVGLAGQIWKTANGGTSWTSHSFNSTDLYGVAFRDARRGYTCGGSAAGGGSPGTSIILSTADSGNTWVQESYSGSGALQSICITGNKLFIAGAFGTILKATIPTSSTGVNHEAAQIRLAVYPNPATNRIFIVNEGCLAGLRFKLVDVTGKVVAERALQGLAKEAFEGDFAKGFYSYTITRDDREILSGKLIIE